MTHTTPTSSAADTAHEPRSKRRGLRLALIIGGSFGGLAIVAVAVLLLLPGGSSNNVEAYRNTPPRSVKYIDGLVITATGSTFVLQTQDHEHATLFVRQPDRPYIDVQHAQTHASLGQPVRVFWKTIDKRRTVVYLADSPLIF